MNYDYKQYLLGFGLSIALTVAGFIMVMKHLLHGPVLILVIVGLGLIQFWVQLIFFIHLDQEKGTRWNLAAFLSTLCLVVILVGASLWIMNNLDYRHIPPADTDTYLLNQENIHK